MRAHLPAIRRIFGAHTVLDERLTGLAQHRHTIAGRHQVDRVPAQPRIMHNPAAGVLAQQLCGQQANQIVAVDEAVVGVEEKAPIEVAILRDPEIRPAFTHGFSHGRTIFRQQRVWNAVGEMTVRLVMDANELERHVWWELIDHHAITAVAGIDDVAQRTQSVAVDVAKQMIDVR